MGKLNSVYWQLMFFLKAAEIQLKEQKEHYKYILTCVHRAYKAVKEKNY